MRCILFAALTWCNLGAGQSPFAGGQQQSEAEHPAECLTNVMNLWRKSERVEIPLDIGRVYVEFFRRGDFRSAEECIWRRSQRGFCRRRAFRAGTPSIACTLSATGNRRQPPQGALQRGSPF